MYYEPRLTCSPALFPIVFSLPRTVGGPRIDFTEFLPASVTVRQCMRMDLACHLWVSAAD